MKKLNDELLHVIEVVIFDAPRVIHQEEEVGLVCLCTCWRGKETPGVRGRLKSTFKESKWEKLTNIFKAAYEQL